MDDIYEPREDSLLILKQIRHYAVGNVLDMGTGTGILALEAARLAEQVYACDINEDALEFAREQAAGRQNIKFVHSDLFSYFKENQMKFDLIIFNPPYLPDDARVKEIALDGGKKGYELIERFFADASEFLMPYGRILVVFSTLTGKEQIHGVIAEYGFNFQKLSEEELFGETIFVYLVEKSNMLRNAEKMEISNIKKIAKGHRGFVYEGMLNKKKVALKKQREDSITIGRIENEARWLKVLNRKGIGPRFIAFKDDWFVYEYIDGEKIVDWLKNAKRKSDIKDVISDVFRQCFVLDRMKINKEEMHHPLKHVLVRNAKPVMIDFERAHVVEKPQNVTQFCQFVSSGMVLKLLKEKGFVFNKREIISAAKRYKDEMSEERFREIANIIV